MLSVSKTVPSVFHARNDAAAGANGHGMRPTRVHIGRRLHNDAKRLEKPFGMYTEMTAEAGAQ